MHMFDIKDEIEKLLNDFHSKVVGLMWPSKAKKVKSGQLPTKKISRDSDL